MRIACIYKITSPNNKIYIGQTINFKKRIYGYRSCYKKGKSAIIDSMLKYGFYSHKIEIIYELPSDINKEIIDEYEIFCINQYKESGAKMLNIRGGGAHGAHSEETKKKIGELKKGNKNNLGKKRTEEAKARMRNSQQNRLRGKIHFNTGSKRTEESKKKMSDSQKIKGIPPEQRQKMSMGISAGLMGRKISDITKEKLRQLNLGKKASDESKLKMKLSDRKSNVSVIDIDTGIKYKTIQLASESANMKLSIFRYYLTKTDFKYKREINGNKLR